MIIDDPTTVRSFRHQANTNIVNLDIQDKYARAIFDRAHKNRDDLFMVIPGLIASIREVSQSFKS